MSTMRVVYERNPVQMDEAQFSETVKVGFLYDGRVRWLGCLGAAATIKSPEAMEFDQMDQFTHELVRRWNASEPNEPKGA